MLEMWKWAQHNGIECTTQPDQFKVISIRRQPIPHPMYKMQCWILSNRLCSVFLCVGSHFMNVSFEEHESNEHSFNNLKYHMAISAISIRNFHRMQCELDFLFLFYQLQSFYSTYYTTQYYLECALTDNNFICAHCTCRTFSVLVFSSSHLFHFAICLIRSMLIWFIFY